MPESLARRAAAELDRLHARHPGARSHILTSPFHVPPRWFAAFNPKERELVPGAGGLTIRYRTGRGAAVRRLQRAARHPGAGRLRRGHHRPGARPDRVAARLPQPTPLVELDYGGAARLFSDGELATDETVEDVAASLRALQRGDFEAAGEHYGRVAARWSHAQSLTFAS